MTRAHHYDHDPQGDAGFEAERQRKFELLQGLGGNAVIGVDGRIYEPAEGGEVPPAAFEPVVAPPIEPAEQEKEEEERPFFERFLVFCDERNINPATVSLAGRQRFATQMLDFIASDARTWLDRHKGEKVARGKFVIPKEVVADRLEHYYKTYGVSSTDSVKRAVRHKVLKGLTAVADRYQAGVIEIQGINLLERLLLRTNPQAVASLAELKSAYGLAINVINKRLLKPRASPQPESNPVHPEEM